MVRELSDPPHAFANLMKAARSGDWAAVEQLSAEVLALNVAPDPEGAVCYLRDLKEALIVTKAARASLLMTTLRLDAAAGFHAAERQNPGEVTGS